MIGNIAAGLYGTGAPPIPPNSYESIATVSVGSGGSTYLTFTSIPSSYKHLQLRMITSSANGDTEGYIEYNSDYTSSNYYYHRLFGNGSVAGSGNGTGSYIFNGFGTGIANGYVGHVVDILDYSNTSKYKTTRNLTGFSTNNASANNWIGMHSTLWKNTAAISSIRVRMNSNAFNQYTHAALYGIKD
jgi:hypothetical protein